MTLAEKPNAGGVDGTSSRTRTPDRWSLARRVRTAVLAVAMSMGLVFLNAGSASALSPGDVIKTDLLRNWATGRCLSLNGISTSVITDGCSGSVRQQWALVYRGTSTYDYVWIKNPWSGWCLTLNHSDLSVSLAACDPERPTQLWAGVGTSWDQVELANGTHDAIRLDSNANGDVYLLPPNGGGYQKWKSGY
ncbi:hypothetical protein HLK59_29510 [Streptomyces sp. S3(2020)]|uniref:RICIN domain-containing protein n=1 Tax=Streptomyces sp. S3(2020) TaxID=2732044 RepID=UPI001489D12E|nr:ricin-type beta-trefoil lectin domain protein [Streptomyces sp. S3(2020)]NNN34425.1 hypothetical protein [Streptomyces sp. S3(2020)]